MSANSADVNDVQGDLKGEVEVEEPAPVLDILYQDEYLVAVNKPSGLFVHRSYLDRHEKYFALQLVRDQVGQYVYPLHRLDRPTSGVLLFALTQDVARLMGEQFTENRIQKTYLSMCRGFTPDSGEIDYPLKEKLDKLGDKYVSEDKPAQEAVSHFQTLAQASLPIPVGKFPTVRYSLVKLKPKTGRRHQLRRHMAHLRHPMLGDINYGDNKQNPFFGEHFGFRRLMLHAWQLDFQHPITDKKVNIRAPLDSQWQQVMQSLQWQNPDSNV
ncbi:tRNA pseudouridine(65) synthase TruC [Thalassotalea sp. PS06]|uniref:tRNA pseudouridine(65) synthase TruC n=1 Tax=Thalassotalea sp. PS06 TaxID=2594005 RepID=UPI001165866B|nr:tRNA pseudouridine(65) synthase TruC [Thalassotalea sp. PS06]QDP01666.1 tRNA pseudouridine(65) synthase TruC [Thalassotalea sp. PS06]